VLDIGAQAAGSLTLALREAANQAPTLIAPDGHSELGPVLRCLPTFRAGQGAAGRPGRESDG
jgi:hypothetical protein